MPTKRVKSNLRDCGEMQRQRLVDTCNTLLLYAGLLGGDAVEAEDEAVASQCYQFKKLIEQAKAVAKQIKISNTDQIN